MRVIALEEHFILPFAASTIGPEAMRERGFPPPEVGRNDHLRPLLMDLGDDRIADLDANGISLQVLSSAGPGADLVDGPQGVALAQAMNDALHARICAHPDRFQGFAHLPMREPEAAAAELERCVRRHGFVGALINGTTEGLFLDHPRFDPILTTAVNLDVPIYLHPALPPPVVRKAYYDGLPGQTGYMLASASWGWHAETALHVLRLIASGTLDRHPGLRLIVGHMGEGLPMMLQRVEDTLTPVCGHLQRSIKETILDQLWITTAGFLDNAPFLAALMTFGADRILFSVDYPFTANSKTRTFLERLPVSGDDLEKIAFKNAEAVLGAGVRSLGEKKKGKTA